jgi:hypothetical protein
MGSSPPKIEKADTGEDARSYIEAMTDPELQEKIISSEREYRPQYQDVNLQDMWGYLQGNGDQGGILDMQDVAGARTEELRSKLASEQREADIADVENLGGRATDALRKSDPLMDALIGKQSNLTNDLYDRAGGISPQQKRQADQQAREAFGARGRVDDNSAVAAEILNREDYMRSNRAEAQASGAQAFGMYKGTAADPFQAILGRPSGALNQGLSTAGQAGGAIGQSTPQLFNPDTGVNIGLQNAANANKYNSATYGAEQAKWGGAMQGFGNMMQGFSFGGG